MSEIPAEEQQRLAEELAEQLRKLRVEDVLVNTLMHVSSIGYRRLGATPDTRDERDLDQVRLAIETMRALTPVLERFVPGELVRDFNSSVANLQLAYAKAATEAGPGAGESAAGGDGEASESPPAATPEQGAPDAGREKEKQAAGAEEPADRTGERGEVSEGDPNAPQ